MCTYKVFWSKQLNLDIIKHLVQEYINYKGQVYIFMSVKGRTVTILGTVDIQFLQQLLNSTEKHERRYRQCVSKWYCFVPVKTSSEQAAGHSWPTTHNPCLRVYRKSGGDRNTFNQPNLGSETNDLFFFPKKLMAWKRLNILFFLKCSLFDLMLCVSWMSNKRKPGYIWKSMLAYNLSSSDLIVLLFLQMVKERFLCLDQL